MEFCINAKELRKALADIEQAEKNGFNYCQAVFKLTSVGESLEKCRARYSDLSEKAHPTNGDFDWGRFQSVSKNNIFKDGKLIRIEKEREGK